MDRKNTGQLLQELMESNDLDRVLSENDTSFREGSLTDALQRLFDARDISKAMLAKNSGISEVYLHQVFSGRRSPSRNRLLCLCFGLDTDLEEAQRLLQYRMADKENDGEGKRRHQYERRREPQRELPPK